MIYDLAEIFEDIAKNIGVSIRIPRPDKRMLNISRGINFMAGIILGISGLVFSKKYLFWSGGLHYSVLFSYQRSRAKPVIIVNAVIPVEDVTEFIRENMKGCSYDY